jgi:phosphotriesterase-related protein
MTSTWIQTVKGPVPTENLGLILPHEHLFVDLRGPMAPDYAEADPEIVVRVMEPFLRAAHTAGVTALVECSTPGVGRNVAVLQHLAEITPIHIIAPTGVYRDELTPPALRDLSVEQLAKIWITELTEGMEGTKMQAGFIKLAVTSDGGPTPLEERNLKAAALASQQTGAVIASHTGNGEVARREMDILESAGLDLTRFIWVHANLEPDTAIHLEAAQRGAYVEFDAIGAAWQPQPDMVAYTLALIESGHEEHILLSHDAGWYEAGRPDGRPEDGFRGFTDLIDAFIPALRTRGVTDDLVHVLTVTNPTRAFAFVGD